MSNFEENLIQIPAIIENEDHLPIYMTKEAAGADIKASVKEPIVITPGHSALIPTGLSVAIPPGFEIQLRPRSGLALKNQITLLNTPATIDSDYRGEIKVILINHGKDPFIVTNGMRIAQLIVAPVVRASFVLCNEFATATERGSNGFGHTG